MTISPTAVSFDEDTMWVHLSDGRTIGVPLAWFPRLLNATEQGRQQVQLSRLGLHWEHLDEDISVAGLLAGQGNLSRADRKSLLKQLRTFRGRLPADFKFDRNDANAR